MSLNRVKVVGFDPSEIKVVGFDPSLRNFGVVKASINIGSLQVRVDSVQLIQPSLDKTAKKTVRKNSDDLRRARWLQSNMILSCKDCSFAMIEMPVGSQSARAMTSYGIVVGVLSSCPLPIIEVTPTEVKLAGAGDKKASKQEMIDWAVSEHSEAKWLRRKSKGEMILMNGNEHIADALAAIYAGINTEQFKTALSIYRQMNLAA
ncbi:MAG: hypothetical protein IBX56_20145 [Methylomicrobium sp.]|nr:hypothetical protein [Methylomicrobium sp.]